MGYFLIFIFCAPKHTSFTSPDPWSHYKNNTVVPVWNSSTGTPEIISTEYRYHRLDIQHSKFILFQCLILILNFKIQYQDLLIEVKLILSIHILKTLGSVCGISLEQEYHHKGNSKFPDISSRTNKQQIERRRGRRVDKYRVFL